MAVTRRDFLRKTATVVAVGLAVPPWLSKMVWADGGAAMNFHKDVPNDRVLVVVQLTGGNDGINTLIPYSNALYKQNRPNIGIPDNQVLHLDNNVGLNPSMTSMKQLYDSGKVAVIQGVGYPNPNRSHFRSMEIWQTAAPDRAATEGWVGRYLDAVRDGRASTLTGINIGSEQSEALVSAHSAVPSITGLSNLGMIFPNNPEGELRSATLRRIQTASNNSPYGAFLQQTASEMYDSNDRIKAGVANYKSKVAYQGDSFSRGMQEIAMLISANLGTRIFYISTGGFDTHTAQTRRQPQLLKQLSDGLQSFTNDMDQMGLGKKVAVVTFSEFGRRVHENAGGGTDHGTASEMFIVGGGIKGGLYGDYPSLTDLDQGDLKFNTDFRSVYASVLDKWMGVDSERVLGERFPDMKFI